MAFAPGLFPLVGPCWLRCRLSLLGSGFGGLILALVIGFIYAVTMIFQSTNVVMAMNGAREVDEQTAPNLIMWLRIWLW